MRSNLVVTAALLALAAYIFFAAGALPFGTIRVPQTAFFPKILAVLLALLAVILCSRRRSDSSGPEDAAADGAARRRVGTTLAALAGFALGLEALGFVLTAFVTMVFLLRASEAQGWLKILLIAMTASLLSHALFGRILGVPLPSGVLGI